jgi:hypothetical protein
MPQYDNYETDGRVMAGRRGDWFKSLDERKQLVSVEIYDADEDEETIVDFPMKWEVCGLCNGRGKHVNPSIDCNGLTGEDFAEDPDFAQDYFAGRYDQQCNCCHGRTTVPAIDEDRLDEDQKKWLVVLQDQQEEQRDYEREAAWERRMGC